MTWPAAGDLRRPSPSLDSSGGSAAAAVAVTTVAAVVYVWVLIARLHRGDEAIGGALLVAPFLVVATIPLAARAARDEHDARLRGLLLAALLAKMAGGGIRYLIAFSLYDGRADANRYHFAGLQLAESFSAGNWDLGSQSLVGTRFVEVLTGVVYWVTGPSKLAGFLVFSWLGFLGLYWFYRAFRTAVPEGDHRLYALLLFFLPSLLFWPSSIGKESWMMATLGLAAYGVAGVLHRRRGGILRLVLGLWGAAMVRPHVALLLLAGLGMAVLLHRSAHLAGRRASLGPAVRIVCAGAIAVAFVSLLGTASENFEVGQERRAERITDVRDYANQQTEQGGSSFEAEPIRSPLDFPLGFVSVLFRPFPNEVSNTQGLVSAGEGTALLAFACWRFRSLGTFLRRLRRVPYLLASAVFILGFVWGFSSFGNFGILVRQRVQVYPFLLVALCLPAVRRVASASGAPRRPPAPPATEPVGA